MRMRQCRKAAQHRDGERERESMRAGVWWLISTHARRHMYQGKLLNPFVLGSLFCGMRPIY